MDVALGIVAFWPALALGSFLNVVAARVPLHRSVVRPASACMSCGSELAWRDNLPVVSWLLLRGRCRTCGTGISAIYPAVELATAGLVASCFVVFGLTGKAFVASFFCVVLVVLSAIDLKHRIVPNRIVVPAAVVILVAQTALSPSPEWALGAIGASGFLLLAALAYPAGMGMGDVKLALLLGAMLGRVVGVGLMLGMIAALVPSLVLLARHGSAARKMGIPFAPFLALGALIALFVGHPLLDAYLNHF
ncbi:MAG: leader peptidase (prepilin peptidase) / N-methyltransferase [Gaiellales bacterium]|nr:leader peptidase (prepilin peptidase) / N-methyltransferase [Gaiellales bacterium]